MVNLPDTPSMLLVQALRLGVVVLLYALLLRLLWTLRGELRSAPGTTSQAAAGAPEAYAALEGSEAIEPVEAVGPVLVVVDVTANERGEPLPSLIGRRFHLAASNVIGRDPTSSIVIPEAHVSRRHARIDYRDGEWWLDDLDSMNGTYLDERQVREPTSVLLDDVIRLGGVALAVREERV